MKEERIVHMSTIDFDAYEKRYAVTRRVSGDVCFEAGLDALTRTEGARSFLTAYAPVIPARTLDVAGTYSASWIGRLCAAFHDALWRDGVALDCSLANVTLSIRRDRDSGHASLSFCLREGRAESLPEEAGEERVRLVVSAYYSEQIRPLLESIAPAAGVDAGALWGQVATRLMYFWDQWENEADTGPRKLRLERHTALLFRELPGDCFGRRRNPFDLKPRRVDNPKQPGALMRLKASCCLAFKTDTGHGYCYTCPRLTDEEREAVKRKHYGEAIAVPATTTGGK